MRQTLVFCFLALASMPPLAAGSPQKAATKPKKPTIVDVDATPDPKTGTFTQQVLVTFKSAVPDLTNPSAVSEWTLVIYYKAPPAPGAAPPPLYLQGTIANNVAMWTKTIVGTLANSNPIPPARTQTGDPAILVTPDKQTVVLTLPENTLTSDVASLMVSFDGTQFMWNPPEKTLLTSWFKAAPNQSQSDNYLTGSYGPALHSSAQYTINAQGSLVKEVATSGIYLGGVATVATNDRPTADPDSFLVSGLLQWVPVASHFGVAQGVLLNWDFAGLEFDRQTTTQTFISSPILEIPLRLYPQRNGSLNHFTASMYPYFGFATGTNLSNALEKGGSGFIFRGVFGTSISLTYKTNWKLLQQIGLTATDTVRIPATNEIFTYTHYISATGKTVSTPVLSTQVRNHLLTQLNFTVAKPFSITVKYEYGELPPAFRTVNTVSIGVSILLQQANTGRAKTDPEK